MEAVPSFETFAPTWNALLCQSQEQYNFDTYCVTYRVRRFKIFPELYSLFLCLGPEKNLTSLEKYLNEALIKMWPFCRFDEGCGLISEMLNIKIRNSTNDYFRRIHTIYYLDIHSIFIYLFIHYRCTVHSDIHAVHSPTDAHLLKL